MAVTKIGYNQWKSSLLTEVFDSEQAARHYDERQEQTMRGRTEQEQFIDGLSAEQIRPYLEREMLTKAYEDAAPGGGMVIDVWLEAHPEWKKPLDIPANANQVALYLKMHKGNSMPRDTGDLDEAVEALSRAGVLKPGQAEMAAKHSRKVKAEAKRFSQRRELTEDEMYAMPRAEFDKLRGVL